MKKLNKSVVSVLAMGVLMVGLSGCQRGADEGGAATSGSSGTSGTAGSSGMSGSSGAGGTGAGGAGGGTSGGQR